MSHAVGTALRRLAASLLGDRKVWNTLAGILLGILVMIVMPVSVVFGLFQGGWTVDRQQLQETVVAEMAGEELSALQQVYDRITAIDAAMTAAGFGDRKEEAEVLFVLTLSEHAEEEDFVETLVSCFAEGQTDAELLAAVSGAFGVEVAEELFTGILRSVRAATISTSGYIDPSTKNNLDLAQWAIHAEQAGWGYVWGTHGQVLTEAQLEASLSAYPYEVGRYEDFIRSHWLGGRTSDCVGLIKGYGWFNPETGSIDYGANGMPDLDADSMYRSAAEKGPIATIPEIPGLAVWHTGHIGIYIGNGEVIEAMGTRYGVVRTALSERGWTHWLKVPSIEYRTEENEMDDNQN